MERTHCSKTHNHDAKHSVNRCVKMATAAHRCADVILYRLRGRRHAKL